MPSRVAYSSLTVGALLLSAPVFSSQSPVSVPAKPAAAAKSATSNYEWAPDALEARWSWRATVTPHGDYQLNVAFGCVSDSAAADGLILRLQGDAHKAQIQLIRQDNGKLRAPARPISLSAGGQLSLQRIGRRLRVLWNGETVLEQQVEFPGKRIGFQTMGAADFEVGDVQPTEPVIFRDDFMRAAGPTDTEAAGEWTMKGVWKTSGTMRPRLDTSLSPNPFVFRASTAENGAGAEPVATAGKWFWSDYSITASVRPTLDDPKSALVAAVEAYRQPNGTALRAEVDFRNGVAYIKQGNKILATSAAFEGQPNQWHRIRLDPGPGTVKLLLDGAVLATTAAKLSQGPVALAARVGGANYVDFDDVRVGAEGTESRWGEGALPERFTKDRLMQYWASNARSWQRAGTGIWWHTGDFFGPATVDLQLPKMKAGEGLLVVRAGEDKQVRGSFSITKTGETSYKWHWDRNGQTRSGEITSTDTLLRVSDFSAALGSKEIFTAPITVSAEKSPEIRVGIRPTQDGAGVPLQPLQTVSLSSNTIEREDRTVIGVNITPITAELAKDFGLPDANGAIVDAIEPGAPAIRAGVLVGDVIREVEGKKITDIDSLVAAVGGIKAGTNVNFKVLRRPIDPSSLDWENVRVTTPRVLDYSFTSAPVDWQSAKGVWEVAERWTCSPQWSFFAGKDDVNPTLWSRFSTRGDWTLEAYLATPMDLARGERSPTDLNISVGGDGHDLASGYSFLFAGKSRSVNQIRRGDEVVWEKPFQPLPGAGDTHQDWFYIRLEKRDTDKGRRFRYFVNGRLIQDYTDANPLADGGRLAFWTLRGGLSIARVRLWNSELAAPQAPFIKLVSAPAPAAKPRVTTPTAKAAVQLTALDAVPTTNVGDLTNDLGTWVPREQPGFASTLIQPSPGGVTIKNAVSGGDWTFYATRQTFDVRKHPIISFDYALAPGVKLNLYALVDGRWREIVFSGARRSTADSDSDYLGTISDVKADSAFHTAQFDMLTALKAKGLQGDAAKVEALAFAAPDVDYLRAGLGGNHWGSTLRIRNFKSPEKLPAPAN